LSYQNDKVGVYQFYIIKYSDISTIIIILIIIVFLL